MRRSASILGLAVVMAASAAIPASAHVYVASRSPGKGATVSKASKVQVRFTKQLLSGSMTVKRKSNGNVVGTGGMVNATTVKANTGSLSSGRYGVTVRIVAGDGHSQTVRWSFRVKK
jgi:methionine-rich copper-binding protein CopC